MLVEITANFLKMHMDFPRNYQNHFPLTRSSPWSPLIGNKANTVCCRQFFPFSIMLLLPLLPGPSKFPLTIGYKPLPVTATILIILVGKSVSSAVFGKRCLPLAARKQHQVTQRFGEQSSLSPPHGKLHPSHQESKGKQ